MSLAELSIACALCAGTGLALLAAVGVLRLPDVYTRLSATSKAAPLGTALLLFAAAGAFGGAAIAARVAGIAVFLCLTAPVAAHLLARAAYVSGTPRWRGTRSDALAERGSSDARAPTAAD